MDTESKTSSASRHSLRGVYEGGVRGTCPGRGGRRVGRRQGRGGRRGGRRGSSGGRGQVALGQDAGQVARGRGAGRGVVRPAETEDERKEYERGTCGKFGRR